LVTVAAVAAGVSVDIALTNVEEDRDGSLTLRVPPPLGRDAITAEPGDEVRALNDLTVGRRNT
jgi:hypothetical protein